MVVFKLHRLKQLRQKELDQIGVIDLDREIDARASLFRFVARFAVLAKTSSSSATANSRTEQRKTTNVFARSQIFVLSNFFCSR